jgi:hypothetical protein
MSPAPALFPSGSRTGENTFLSVTLGFPDLSETTPLATVPAVVEPLRTPDLAGDPAGAFDLARIRAGDGAGFAAEERRVGFVVASS